MPDTLPSAPPAIPLFLALSRGKNFGWGVCSHYLKQELSTLYPATCPLDKLCAFDEPKQWPGPVLHALTSVALEPLYRSRGTLNFGYTFFEQEPTAATRQNAQLLDLIFCGSSWNQSKLAAAGIPHAKVLIQGIDPAIFNHTPPKQNGPFVIFSGGKFEFRKGQDLVIRATAIFQQRHKDVILLNAWHNPWPQTMLSMNRSSVISCSFRGSTHQEIISNLLADNGVDLSRTLTLGPVPHERLRELYSHSDIGLFPNRCEGGTNLVLMEYMATGRPVIATYATGQADVLTPESGFLLTNSHPLAWDDDCGYLLHDWVEPDLDEILNALETAYSNRTALIAKGLAASTHMRQFTWQRTAQTLLTALAPFLHAPSSSFPGPSKTNVSGWGEELA